MGSHDVVGDALEYFPYRYGSTGQVFRGPKPRFDGRYVAVVGGSETYGKFVKEPYPSQLEAILGLPVANFGCMHAGVGVFAGNDAVIEACRKAEITVLQIMGAGNTTNGYYAVHPRRNDRFLKATPLLRGLFPTVDFTEFNFTRHLLTTLAERSPEAFAEVRDEVRRAWLEGMKLLIDRIGGRIVLLWMSRRNPDAGGETGLGDDPLFVDRGMIEALRDDVSAIVEAVASAAARDETCGAGGIAPVDLAAAAEVPGPRFHLETALALFDAMAPLLEAGGAGVPPRALDQAVRAFR